MLIWLAFMFINLALVVDARVVPNVTSIAKMLKMSDSLAGLTLLAFGNGVVDIFSAGASVMASKDGGTMGISILLGCGLYVVTVVAGVVAFNFEPDVRLQILGRDVFFYMLGLIWTAYVLADHQLKLWETIGFPVLYMSYLTYAIIAEKIQGAPAAPDGTMRSRIQRWFKRDDTEKLPIVAKSAEHIDNEYWDAHYEGVHPGIIKALSRYENLKAHTESLDHANIKPGSWAQTFSRMDIWDTHEGAPWKRKSALCKIVVMLQMPMRIVLSLSTPVVFFEDLRLGWDKRLHILMAFFSFPTVVILVEEDAFYWKSSQEAVVPSLAIALAVGFCCAYLLFKTSTIDEPPKYNNLFAFFGFTVALVFIYAISEE